MSSENNKRIAQNTMMLYFRMILVMAVSLFTVRVVLRTLGIVDYGIYNVVGGIVGMFSFLSNTMASASQRYFAFELGRSNIPQLERTFCMTVTIYLLISLIVFILAETLGLWFLNNKMTIPAERLDAANWVYQFAILSFIITILTIPYNAAIIAHERMKMYAYVSVVEVIVKLIVVYFLVLFHFDKLKLYAIMMLVVTVFITFIYRSYCKNQFSECRYQFRWERSLFKELVSYSGWNLFGAFAGIFNNQGINIVLNIFFGPVVNAARGIACQVNSAINQFVLNFMTATRPQITKYYASGEKESMVRLVFQSSKFSFLLLFILSMPVLLETKYVLTLWLNAIPEYAVIFTRLVIITSLIDSLSIPLMTAAQATGKIKKYQAIVGGIMLLSLPVSCVFLKLNFKPPVVMIVSIAISVICLLSRLILLRQMVGFPVILYAKQILFSIASVTIVAYIIPLFLLFAVKEGPWRFLTVGFTGVICSLYASYRIAFSHSEKQFALNHIQKVSKSFKRWNIKLTHD